MRRGSFLFFPLFEEEQVGAARGESAFSLPFTSLQKKSRLSLLQGAPSIPEEREDERGGDVEISMDR